MGQRCIYSIAQFVGTSKLKGRGRQGLLKSRYGKIQDVTEGANEQNMSRKTLQRPVHPKSCRRPVSVVTSRRAPCHEGCLAGAEGCGSLRWRPRARSADIRPAKNRDPRGRGRTQEMPPCATRSSPHGTVTQSVAPKPVAWRSTGASAGKGLAPDTPLHPNQPAPVPQVEEQLAELFSTAVVVPPLAKRACSAGDI